MSNTLFIFMKRVNSILGCIGFILLLFLIDGCNRETITTITSEDGVSISFDKEGKGEPVIILVHGWSNNRSIWKTQVSHFSKKYEVIAVDLPGFGNSGNNRNEWTIDAYGADISNIIEELNLNNVVLVGFSMGGPVIIEAANKVPDHVIGVVLVDTLQDVEMQIPAPMAHYLDSLMMNLVNNPTKDKIVEGGYVKKNVDSSFNRIAAFLDGASHIGWRESLASIITWQNEQCTHSIKTVKAPIVSINSDMRPTNVQAFRKYVPSFKAKIVEDVGHLIMWDDAEEFNRLLEESIQEFMSHGAQG